MRRWPAAAVAGLLALTAPVVSRAGPPDGPAAPEADPVEDTVEDPAQDPAQDPSEGPHAAPDAEAPPPPLAAVDGPVVRDGVLPCGLHVVVARDATLPVAAVVLALETGSEDDPGTQPGLVHALAYQLLQGNRELAPGGAAALVHNAGGVSLLAVGPAQTRYESLVPASRLDAVLWSEAQRLRAPTVSAALWADSLRWARRDKPRKWSVSRAALAAAHQAPGLVHEGSGVGPELSAMAPRAVANAIAERFAYRHATLVVVAPGELDETWGRVAAAFDDLPAAARALPPRLTTPARASTASAPRQVAVDRISGPTFVWPIAPNPSANLHATVWCMALNRQRRGEGEPSRARVRCRIDADPRRAVMVVGVSGVPDATALLSSRLGRLQDGSDDALLEKQRQVVLADDAITLRTPLTLARRLSQDASADAPTNATGSVRSLASATGHGGTMREAPAPAASGTETTHPLREGSGLRLPAAILLVEAPAPKESVP